MSGETELSIGLVGSGRMGLTYAECLARYNRGARLVAICGGSRAPGLAARYSVDHEPTLDGLFGRRDVDAVIIATPHSRHCEQVIRAAEAGKHVLVEKPMATSTVECDAMIGASRRAGVALGVIQTARYTVPASQARQLIAQGRIGRVLMLQLVWLEAGYAVAEEKQWVSDPAEGGAFLDAGVHAFDLLRWLTGAEAERVFARVTSYIGDPLLRLSGQAEVVYVGGAMASVWISFELPAPGFPERTMRTRVVGSDGLLDIDSYGKLLLGDGRGWAVVAERTPYDFARITDPARLEQFIAQTQDFIAALRDGRDPPVRGEDGRAAVELVEACYRSSSTGLPVTFERWGRPGG